MFALYCKQYKIKHGTCQCYFVLMHFGVCKKIADFAPPISHKLLKVRSFQCYSPNLRQYILKAPSLFEPMFLFFHIFYSPMFTLIAGSIR